MADKSLWISSEPFTDEEYHNTQTFINDHKGKKFAVLECFHQIPCNPCEEACPRQAISVGKQINDLPVLDAEKCTGCGICIPNCPGQAIFVIDTTQPDFDRVSIPYEYLPLPVPGLVGWAMDRHGQDVGPAKVVKTIIPVSFNKTAVVILEVPRGLGSVVRGISFK